MLETEHSFEHRGQVETHSQGAEWELADKKHKRKKHLGKRVLMEVT